MTNAPLQSSDIWLLLAVIQSSGDPASGAGLAEIISAGDAINHAIFTDAELESGLYRLTKGGLLGENEGRFLPTEKASNLYRQATSGGRGIYKAWEYIEKKLGVTRYTGPLPNPADVHKYPGFSSEAAKRSRAERHSKAQAISRKIKKRKT